MKDLKKLYLQKVFEEIKLKKLVEYHDLYVQSDALLLANVFEKFKNECLKYFNMILLII